MRRGSFCRAANHNGYRFGYTPKAAPKPVSAYEQAIGSVAQADIQAGRASGDMMGLVGGEIGHQYLKRGNHDVFEQPNRAEATFTADLVRESGQGLGNTMMRHGSDRVAHDGDTSYNLQFSQNPDEYRAQMDKATTDSANAWRNTDTDNDRRNIEKNAENVQKSFNERRAKTAHTTAKIALGINGALTVGEAKMPTAVEVAHELRKNRRDWEDARSNMMTPQDIRTDTAEHYASDMEDYLSQTAIGEHLVNLAKVRAYRGAFFMMSNAVDMFDKSFDVWADNIIEKGDHSYLNALHDTIIQDHPTTDDVLVNVLAKFMGGNNGDAVIFLDSVYSSFANTFNQRAMQRTCTAAAKVARFFAYLVAMPLQRLR